LRPRNLTVLTVKMFTMAGFTFLTMGARDGSGASTFSTPLVSDTGGGTGWAAGGAGGAGG
jgi:hypothetical protein